MSSIATEQAGGGVVRLILRSGRGNPITPQLVADLNQSLDALAAAPPRALVLDADGSKIFSGGFALPVIAHWDRPQLRSFFEDFLSALHKLLGLGCPTIAAVEGHAIAGGFILSLGCDLRIVSSGRIKLGLSEVDLGVAVPAGARVLLEARTSSQHALRMAMRGELIGSDRALEIGYADAASESPLEDALSWARQLASKPGSGATVTRQLASHPISSRMKRADEEGMDAFLETWFSETGQTCIQALAESLGGKS
jgi:enoyl-CoA hydratase/carnithine racemase